MSESKMKFRRKIPQCFFPRYCSEDMKNQKHDSIGVMVIIRLIALLTKYYRLNTLLTQKYLDVRLLFQ